MLYAAQFRAATVVLLCSGLFSGCGESTPPAPAAEAPAAPVAEVAPSTTGTLALIKVHGAALEGNLEGDPADRDVYVYLPPSYASSTSKRYPVVYFLHGYGVGASVYVERVLNLPASADTAIANGATEAIVVVPDAFTRYSGSMYSSSPTTGDWEAFVTHDLVSYIDSNYRTLATRESRGLSGHSMGGYGTLRIGMKHPELFSSLYAMSSCCLMNTPPTQERVEEQNARMAAGIEAYKAGSFDNVLQAQAAAWAPNPQNAPVFFDFPFVNGEANAVTASKWAANSPLAFVDQYVPELKQYEAIAMDVGDKDNLSTTNTQMDASLTALGVTHSFEVYDGDHGNRVGARFIEKLLPFFSQHLDPQ